MLSLVFFSHCQCQVEPGQSSCKPAEKTCQGKSVMRCEGEKWVKAQDCELKCGEGTCLTKGWVLHAGGPGEDNTQGVAVDKEGNVYFVGYLAGKLTFQNHEVKKPGGYIAKVDKDGKYLWSHVIKSETFSGLWGVLVGTDGTIYARGSFSKTITFGGKQYAAKGKRDAMIISFAKDGKIKDFIQFESPETGYIRSLTLGPKGALFASGVFIKQLNVLGKKLDALDKTGLFVVKLEKGKLSWAINGSAATTEGTYASVAVAHDGEVYVTGPFENKIKFASQELASKGEKDIFLGKWDKDGKFAWLKTFGGKKSDVAMSIALNQKKEVYLSGAFVGELPLDGKTLHSNGKSDLFVSKLSPEGKVMWATSAGGPGGSESALDLEYAGKIVVDGSTAFITGGFQEQFKLGKTLVQTQAKASDIYIAKLNDKGEFVWAITPGGKNETWDRGFDVVVDAHYLYIGGKFTGTRTMEAMQLKSNGFLDFFVWKLLKP